VARSELNCPRHEMRGFSCQTLHSLYTPLRKQTVLFLLFTSGNGCTQRRKCSSTIQHNTTLHAQKRFHTIFEGIKKSVSYCVHYYSYVIPFFDSFLPCYANLNDYITSLKLFSNSKNDDYKIPPLSRVEFFHCPFRIRKKKNQPEFRWISK